ncbi:hypothetical protein AGMMS49546_00780 [Spirochaetia bacterium]|nr:hypothetical protein AGMMS49546_00780 [Spirochaetia bacterium]
MMKKFTAIVLLTLLIAGFINAQSIDRSRYEGTTLSAYELWLNKAGQGDTKKFKASVLYSMRSKTIMYFTDLDGGSFNSFDAGPEWPDLQEDQPVVIYFTATGALNRIIDAIDTNAAVSGNAAAQSRPAPGAAANANPAPDPRNAAPAAAAKITGNIPQSGSRKAYRLQVGSFLISANAVRAFNKLRDAGLDPAYERYSDYTGDYIRVVLPGVRADDIPSHALKIGVAGFRDIWCREER